MFQIVRQRGRYDVRLDNSPMFARYDDADAWVSDFVRANQDYSRTGPEALSVGAIVPEGRTPDDPCY